MLHVVIIWNFIENVISYRENLKRKTELEFQVKWLGYDETHNSWEPYVSQKSFAKKLHTANSLVSIEDFLPFLPLQLTWLKVFGSF